jgi:CheY-like chemotaxis protein
VLCAEDVRTNQIIVSTLLEGMGHESASLKTACRRCTR